MLIKAVTIISLPVFTLYEGKKIGSVQDVIYHPKDNKIEALMLSKGGWFSEARVVLFDNIENIGDDVVLIKNEAAIKNASEVEADIEYIAKNDTYLTGTKIITTQGSTLGKVTD